MKRVERAVLDTVVNILSVEEENKNPERKGVIIKLTTYKTRGTTDEYSTVTRKDYSLTGLTSSEVRRTSSVLLGSF